jgi:hypothetical protein
VITCQGSVAYPPTADGRPIRALAANLRQLAKGLQQSSGDLAGTAGSAARSWTGAAAEAFAAHTGERVRTIASVGRALAEAAPVLETFAAAIDATASTYSLAATAEHALRCGLPWTATEVMAAIAQQMAAVASLQAAGAACAGALLAIEAEIAAAQFSGVDRSTLDALTTSATAVWDNVVELVESGDADAAVAALDHTVDVVAALATLAAGRATIPVRPAPATHVDARRHELVELGHDVHAVKDVVKPVLLGVEGGGHGLEHGTRHAAQVVRRRNGTVYTRWTAAGRGSLTGLTQQQAARLSAVAGRWLRPVPAVAAAADGAAQYLTDEGNATLTMRQRVNRTGAATVLGGGGAWAGAVAGAQWGAAGGAAAGAALAGVGAVPGSIAGGIVGAIGGGLVGSSIGQWAKEQLFARNPAGAFR